MRDIKFRFYINKDLQYFKTGPAHLCPKGLFYINKDLQYFKTFGHIQHTELEFYINKDLQYFKTVAVLTQNKQYVLH